MLSDFRESGRVWILLRGGGSGLSWECWVWRTAEKRSVALLGGLAGSRGCLHLKVSVFSESWWAKSQGTAGERWWGGLGYLL